MAILSSVISFKDVSLNFGGVQALDDISFDIEEGSLFAIIGPNGAGKTSAFNCINGIYRPTTGSVNIFDKDISDMKPDQIADLGISRTFQNIELFENMTALDNILIGAHRHIDYGSVAGLLFTKKAREEEDRAREIAEDIIDFLEIEEHRFSFILSLPYGIQKRIELARALAMKPKVLLLDEPLSALDLKLRQAMRFELKTLQRETGITFVFVTHDQEEALTMSDRIAVINEGEIQQIGEPEQIYESPSNKFVANFIGEANLLSGVCKTPGENGVCELGTGHELNLFVPPHIKQNDKVTIFIRPERIKIEKSSKDKSQLSISEFTYLGNAATIQLKSNNQLINVNLPIEDLKIFKKDDYVDIHFPKESAQVID